MSEKGTKWGKVEDRVKARRKGKTRFNVVEFAVSEIAEAKEVVKAEVYKAAKTNILDFRDLLSV
jgi:hypothetical protein